MYECGDAGKHGDVVRRGFNSLGGGCDMVVGRCQTSPGERRGIVERSVATLGETRAIIECSSASHG